jgi:hypothetical protein
MAETSRKTRNLNNNLQAEAVSGGKTMLSKLEEFSVHVKK